MTLTRLGLVLCAGVLATTLAAAETRLLRYPDISRTHVVFSYGADLWTAPRAGGSATRLTSYAGDELYAKFSPDGKWIAFTGEYDGNSDVYVIPSTGGEPKRLTFHPSNDIVLGWTPDSRKILFRSDRFSANPGVQRLLLVSFEGGQAEELPMKRGSLGSFSPDGAKIAFTPNSLEMRTWKRYRGGLTTHIGIFDLAAASYQDLPRVNASDMFPMWYGEAVYFISDREGVMNLYRHDLRAKKTTRLTSYQEYDIKWPSLGADAITYENGGQLFAYDLKKNQPQAIPVTVASDSTLTRPELKTLAGQVREFSLSPSAARALIGARGEVFTVPAEKGSPRNLTESAGIHELGSTWSPDGKWIAYFSDRSGEYEIYLRPQMGGDEVRITTDGQCYRFGLTWSPDSKKLAYWDKKLRAWYVDIDDKKPVQFDSTDHATGYLGGWDWSPDSKWIAFTRTTGGNNRSLLLYSLEQKKSFPVADEFYDQWSPRFDRNGKYLYFLSQRYFYPSGGGYEPRFTYYNMVGIFAVTLKADEPSPFAPQSDEEKVADEKKPDEKKIDEKKPDEKKPEEKKADAPKPEAAKPVPVVIDVDGIGQRIIPVPVPPANYSRLAARKEKLFYLTVPIEAGQMGRPGPPRPMATLHVYDVKKREAKAVLEGINSYEVDKEGTKVLYRSMETYGIVDAAPGKKVGDGRLNLAALQADIDPREEWKQILKEAWRIERDFYWDPNMGGLDWAKIGSRYEALLPWVSHRSDLNYLIGDMIAELNTSHTYVSGGDMPSRRQVNTGLLGADFAAEGGYYKLAKIYRGQSWDEQRRAPLVEPGLKVKEGNYLIAVNGVPVRAGADVYSYFQGLADKLITLKINDKPAGQGAWEITVKPVGNERELRYLDWVEANRKKVHEATDGRIGYMHVPNTATEGLMMFDRYLNGELPKEGFIIDERNNGGGMVPDFFTEKLGRKFLAMLAPREGKDIPWPPVAVFGPKIMLVNEMAGSGGDAFPWFFQKEKIGTVVGTRTWGGLVGISRGIPMLDGGNVTAPETGFWTVNAKGQSEWVAENVGVHPDIIVEQRPDLEAKGQDPQLEKAIEMALAGLTVRKPMPARPKYPPKTFTAPIPSGGAQ